MSAVRRIQESPRSPWVALAVLTTGFFMLMLDASIVNVAVPTMLRDLHTNLNGIVWVNSVYLLTYAVPLMIGGRLGDRFGRKETFMAGMAVFTAASLACGLSSSVGVLIAARAVQGLGAAVMAPQTMAYVGHLFPADRRGAAMGTWGAVGAVAATAGPLLGGALVDTIGWRWIFMVNVPIGVAGLVLAAVLLPAVGRHPESRFDLLGVALSALGLSALVFGLQDGEQYRWGDVVGPVTVWEIIAAGLVLLAAFVAWQRRYRGEALLPLQLFRFRGFSSAAVAVAFISLALTGLYLPLMLYIQTVLGYSPLMSALITLPSAVGASIAGPLSGRLSDRLSARYVAIAGCAVFAASIGVIAALAGPDTSPWLLRGAMLASGLGAGSVYSPLAGAAMGGLPLPLMGAAAGAYSTFRQVGAVIGSAAVGVLLEARFTYGAQVIQQAQSPALAQAVRQSLTGAARETLLVPVAFTLLALLACAWLPRGHEQAHQPAAPAAPLARTGQAGER
jgi:EmrB/QacA subfamily drug resistance transporter